MSNTNVVDEDAEGTDNGTKMNHLDVVRQGPMRRESIVPTITYDHNDNIVHNNNNNNNNNKNNNNNNNNNNKHKPTNLFDVVHEVSTKHSLNNLNSSEQNWRKIKQDVGNDDSLLNSQNPPHLNRRGSLAIPDGGKTRQRKSSRDHNETYRNENLEGNLHYNDTAPGRKKSRQHRKSSNISELTLSFFIILVIFWQFSTFRKMAVSGPSATISFWIPLEFLAAEEYRF